MRGIAAIAVCCALAAAVTGAASSTTTLPRCKASQLKLAGALQGATQSLLGTLNLTNRTGTMCALPVAPRRVVLRIGTHVLSTLTVRMTRNLEPPGVPTRRLAPRAGVFVGVQWRNWCGAPRGERRLSVGLTIYPGVTTRASVGRVRTPRCVTRKQRSHVSVSRFIVVPP